MQSKEIYKGLHLVDGLIEITFFDDLSEVPAKLLNLDFSCPPPPVCSVGWDKLSWINHILKSGHFRIKSENGVEYTSDRLIKSQKTGSFILESYREMYRTEPKIESYKVYKDFWLDD